MFALEAPKELPSKINPPPPGSSGTNAPDSPSKTAFSSIHTLKTNPLCQRAQPSKRTQQKKRGSHFGTAHFY